MTARSKPSGGKRRKGKPRRGGEWVAGSGHTASRNKKGRDRWATYNPDKVVQQQEGRVDKLDARQRAIANKRKQLAAAEFQAQAAEEALASRRATDAEKTWLAECWALVALRRAELQELESQMVKSPASAEHRGTKSYRPVPNMSRAPRV